MILLTWLAAAAVLVAATPAGDTPAGATPAGVTPAGATTAGATTAGATPTVEIPAGAISAEETLFATPVEVTADLESLPADALQAGYSLATAAGAPADGTPEDEASACLKIIIEQIEYDCPDHKLTVNGKRFTIECKNYDVPLEWSRVGGRRGAEGARPSSLVVRRCRLPPALQLARAVGAPAELELQQARDSPPLSADNVRGMNLTYLRIECKSGSVHELPVEAIAALPTLESFIMIDMWRGNTRVPLRGQFPRAPRLRDLELSMLGVRTLPPAYFSTLDHLTNMSLFKNDLTRIEKDAFQGLSSLQQLILSGNPLSHIAGGAFSPTPQLRALYLDDTALAILPGDLLPGLLHLAEVSISSYSRNASLTIMPVSFSRLGALASLSVRGCGVTSLPADLFPGALSLRHLTLAGNKLASLPPRVLSPLQSLQRLSLASNELTSVTRELFSSLAALADLDLSGNRLQLLPESVFSGLERLSRVSLSHNLLSDVSYGTFLGARSLRHLSLAHNRLSWGRALDAYSSPFHMLTHLETLDLSYNNISVLFSDWRFANLTTLNLAHNALHILTDVDGQWLFSPAVDVSYNQITRVLPFTPSPESGFTSPNVTFHLHHNPFTCDCNLYPLVNKIQSGDPRYLAEGATCASPRAFAGVPLDRVDQEELVCDHPSGPGNTTCSCLLRAKHARIECDCDRLDDIPGLGDSGASHMCVRLRPPAPPLPPSLALPPHVWCLTLSGLRLTSVPHVPQWVRSLDLRDNLLEEVPPALLERGVTLWAGGNPLACGCGRARQVALLQRHRARVQDYNATRCADGGALPEREPAGGCGAVAVAGAALAIAAGALLAGALYVWRVELQVLLYSRRWCLRLVARSERDARPYDVFVTFARADERWVARELLPRLAPRRLLVRDRDWEVGATVPAEICRSVEQASRTLVVLTRSYLASAWAPHELRAAHAQAARDRRVRAVLLLPDMSRRQYREVARQSRDTRTYTSLCTVVSLRDVLAWEKLDFALPHADERRERALTNVERAKIAHADRAVIGSGDKTVVARQDKGAGGPVGGTGGTPCSTERAVDMWDKKGLHVTRDGRGQLQNNGFVKSV